MTTRIEWIAVTDKLPEAEIPVLCCDLSTGRYFDGYHDRRCGWLRDNGPGKALHPWVTHWMPLPALPK